MSIKNMHYDFKQKLNKIDSNAYVGLKIPEIDRVLNRALNAYISFIAEPRKQPTPLGFEKIQRTIDDIRPLVANNVELPVQSYSGEKMAIATLPDNYRHYVSGVLIAISNGEEKELKINLIKHDDRNITDVFEESDFDWREINARFYSGGIKLFLNNFTIKKFSIDYIARHLYIHNAENFGSGTYILPDGTTLTGYNDCILPLQTHDEIVDLAVLMTTNDLMLSNEYQMKKDALVTKQIL